MKLSGRWRKEEAIEIREHCMASAAERGDFYHKCRHAFMYGSRDVDMARHNKIKPLIKQLASFLYSPECVTFWPHFPQDELEFLDRQESLSEVVNDSWNDSGINLDTYLAVQYALVCGSSFMTLLPERKTDGSIAVVARMINPEDVGVMREDINKLDFQQAVCWDTYLTRPEIEQRLVFHSPAERRKILLNLESSSPNRTETDRIFVASYSGISGSNTETGLVMSRLGGGYHYTPYLMDGLYKVSNLFVYDDEIGDYSWFLISGSDVINNLPVGRIGVPGMLPIFKICADEIPGFFWGYSHVDGLTLLQDWHSKRLVEMDQLFEKILKPPKVGYGMGQLREAKVAAANRSGSYLSVPNPAAKLEELVPELPDAAFTMIETMDAMFLEAAEMQESQLGRSQPGLRSRDMQSQALRVGASPTKVKAMTVERYLEALATGLFHLKRRYDSGIYPIYKDDGDFSGTFFRMDSLPTGIEIKVDGHSGSPLFSDDHIRLSETLFKAGAIDGETLILFTHPPRMELLLKRQKRRNQAQLVAQAYMKLKQQEKREGSPQK